MKRRGKKPGPPPKADWNAIEAEYRAGVLTVKQIAANHGISPRAISKRAKANGWTRDLKPQVDEMVNRALIPYIGPADSPPDDDDEGANAGTARPTDEEIVDHAARRSVDVILTHRQDIAAVRSLSERMIGELESHTLNREAIGMLIEHIFAGGGEAGAMERALLRQSLKIGERAKTLVNLAKALDTTVKLERQAFGLSVDPVKTTADPIEAERKRADASIGRTPEELAKAMLGILERAARNKATAKQETKH